MVIMVKAYKSDEEYIWRTDGNLMKLKIAVEGSMQRNVKTAIVEKH